MCINFDVFYLLDWYVPKHLQPEWQQLLKSHKTSNKNIKSRNHPFYKFQYFCDAVDKFPII